VAIAFHSDGNTVLTASEDGMVQTWPVTRPLEGTADRIGLATEVNTGMVLDGAGGCQVLHAVNALNLCLVQGGNSNLRASIGGSASRKTFD